YDGLMRRGFWFFLAAVFCFGTLTNQGSAAERVALVIGNNDYPVESAFPDLNNCINDARLIAQTLSTVGFEVIAVYDADVSEMDDALSRFEEKITKGGTALIYFAGHGIEFEGKNYLMGSNAMFERRSRLTREAKEAEVFASAMVLAGAKSAFLFLDCCREIPQDPEWASRGPRRYGLGQIEIEGDIMISMAAAPGKMALEPTRPGSNSPYAAALAKWIPSGLHHRDLLQQVRQDVHEVTGGAQRAWERGSFLEDFYFADRHSGMRPSDPEVRVRVIRDPFGADRGMKGTRAGEVRTFGEIEMVWCPPTGEQGFLMGSPEDEEGRYYEEKQHRVVLSKGFWLAKTECTQGQWESVMGGNPSRFEGSKDLPVETVSWEDVQEWLVMMNREHPLPKGWEWELPTEAQWEYGCRAGTATACSFGEGASELHSFGNFWPKTIIRSPWQDKPQDDGVGKATVEVGSYEPNRWGLYDMHGNVYEWCSEWFGYGENEGGAKRDPAGAEDGTYRVKRGGSFYSYARECRAASRYRVRPESRSRITGFRPAVSFIKEAELWRDSIRSE
ncbi:MAG: SUMF1/EgtB/PvdO family nonheme iron enzyme, partial [Verrucomicrobiota bacterium]